MRELLEQFSVGEVVSTDAFTINVLKAREKLARFQLPASGMWLVKFVQSAVAQSSSEVQIVYKGEPTSLYGKFVLVILTMVQGLQGSALRKFVK